MEAGVEVCSVDLNIDIQIDSNDWLSYIQSQRGECGIAE